MTDFDELNDFEDDFGTPDVIAMCPRCGSLDSEPRDNMSGYHQERGPYDPGLVDVLAGDGMTHFACNECDYRWAH